MITFFRINSILQIISVLVVLLLLKLPFGFGKLPLLVPELEWLLVGQKMSEGNKIYAEVWTSTSPIVSLVYDFITTIGGRDLLSFNVAALILVFLQALYFNYICNKRRLFLEKNYLAAVVYVVLFSLCFDFQKLTPPLICTTFLLMGLNSILKQIESAQLSNNFSFEIGFFLGLTLLTHFPSIVFIIWTLFALIVFSKFSFRQFALLALGACLPLLGYSIYYGYVGSFDEFRVQWLSSVFQIKAFNWGNLLNSLAVFVIPLIFMIFGIFKIFGVTRYNSYQNRSHQALLFLIAASLASIVLSDNSATYQFAILVPGMAFFIVALFLHLKGTAFPELLFLIFLFAACVIQRTGYSTIAGLGYEHLSSLRVDDTQYTHLKGKRILVTGADNSPYKNTEVATKYLNWSLSRIELENPNNYQSVVSIYDSFQKDPPEYIIDNAEVFEEIFRIIPELKKQYRLETRSVYSRVN